MCLQRGPGLPRLQAPHLELRMLKLAELDNGWGTQLLALGALSSLAIHASLLGLPLFLGSPERQ